MSDSLSLLQRGLEPNLRIGLLENIDRARLDFHGSYTFGETAIPEGVFDLLPTECGILLEGSSNAIKIPWNGILSGHSKGAQFTVHEAPVGAGFHWSHHEDLIYTGDLQFLKTADSGITLINHIGLEPYLVSVVSSEMSPYAPPDFLSAHAVVARSWIIAQLGSSQRSAHEPKPHGVHIWEWRDRDDHDDFDLCSDDHCQRYHGIGRISPAADRAVNATRGMVLGKENDVVDARFSKCCGGISEEFSTAWGKPEPLGLSSVVDHDSRSSEYELPLRGETMVSRWIQGRPAAYCNITDPEILNSLTVSMDRDTHDFYRWTEQYHQDELSSLITKRTGIELGPIIALIPKRRGPSGRIWLLEIVGLKGSIRMGKELAIRKALSETHLKSSAFLAVPSFRNSLVPSGFTLHGAGWGHGVGMCQIGAGGMAHRGFTWREIVNHYFPDASLSRLY